MNPIFEKRASPKLLRQVVENYDEIDTDKVKLGLALHRQFDLRSRSLMGWPDIREP